LLELTCLPYNKDLNPTTLGTRSSKNFAILAQNALEFGHAFSLNSENPKYTMLTYLDNL
jgi:hypothetical protein